MSIVEQLLPLFHPRTIAVIGASSNFMKWGCIIPKNILNGGFKGKLFLVNKKEKEIFGAPVYPDLKSVPDEIDLALIVTPANVVKEVMRECGEKKVKAAIVITAGFSETKDGAALEREIADVARKFGIRFVGPNTMGIFSALSDVCAMMPPVAPNKGDVSFVAQSGNLGTQLLSLGRNRGVGFAKFVSSGNEADLRCEDYIEYFGKDEDTNVVLAYIEGLDDGRKFMDIARGVTKKKPFIIFKGGKTNAGVKAARSHCGALAGEKKIYDGAFKQAGVIQAIAGDEMLDLAKAFSNLPLPRGKRVGILTWGGGWGVVSADACEDAGLEVVSLPETLLKEIDKILPAYWSRGNPIDLVGTLDREAHRKCLELLVTCDEVDCVFALGMLAGPSTFMNLLSSMPGMTKETMNAFVSQIHESNHLIRKKVIELMEITKKPIIGVNILPEDEADDDPAAKRIVMFQTPERAVHVMAKLCEYAEYLRNSERSDV